MAGKRHNSNQNRGGNGPPTIEDPLEIWQQLHDPTMRWGDIQGLERLAQLRMLDPADEDLRDLHTHLGRDLMTRAMMAGDPFYGNPPPPGTLPRFGPGLIPIAALFTGDVLSIPVSHAMRNIIVCGPTGGGKSNWLRCLILSVLEDTP